MWERKILGDKDLFVNYGGQTFQKSYCIDWKTAEEKINMEQVGEKINGLEDFIGGGKKYNEDPRHSSFRKKEPMWT